MLSTKRHQGRVDVAHQGQVLVLQLRGLVVASRGAVLHKADKVREHLAKNPQSVKVQQLRSPVRTGYNILEEVT